MFWKLLKKTKFISAEDADITTDKQEIDKEEEVEKLDHEEKQARYGTVAWYVRLWKKFYSFCFIWECAVYFCKSVFIIYIQTDIVSHIQHDAR